MTNLDAARIRGLLSGDIAERLDALDVFTEIDSTNTYLQGRSSPRAGRCSIALADHQTDGRGRRKRRWISAPGSGLCLSLKYSFHTVPANLPALTIALGVDVVRCLDRLGQSGVQLKWPNDLLIGDSKLGGILTETQSRDGQALSVIAGIGINIDVPEVTGNALQSEWAHRPTGLAATMKEPPTRERLAAAIMHALFDTMVVYDESGFDTFRTDFIAADWLSGKHVVVDTSAGDISGLASGIDDTGALRIQTDHGPTTIVSGSIRRAREGAMAS